MFNNFSPLILLYLLLQHKINTHNLYSNEENSKIFKIENKDIVLNNSEIRDNYEQIRGYSNNQKRKLSSSKKNLILGIVTNFNWEVVQPYFKSFEAVGFENCDCVIFVSKLSQNTINKIESCGVITKNIPSEYLYMKLNKMRWKLYLNYINDNLDKYHHILATDTRDTVFQQDLFQIYGSKKPFLGVAFEEAFLNNTVNKDWFIYAFGKEAYKKVENERIICAGTVWGTADKFLLLANKIWEKVKNNATNDKMHDQTVINYIVYNEKIFDDCLKHSEYKDGYILTLGLEKNKTIYADSDDNILNEKGEIAALVHQYDRIKYINEKIKKKFSVEGKINILKKRYKKKLIPPKILFVFAFILIMAIFFLFKLISKRKIRKYGYKKYKIKKAKKKIKYKISKFKF